MALPKGISKETTPDGKYNYYDEDSDVDIRKLMDAIMASKSWTELVTIGEDDPNNYRIRENYNKRRVGGEYIDVIPYGTITSLSQVLKEKPLSRYTKCVYRDKYENGQDAFVLNKDDIDEVLKHIATWSSKGGVKGVYPFQGKLFCGCHSGEKPAAGYKSGSKYYENIKNNHNGCSIACYHAAGRRSDRKKTMNKDCELKNIYAYVIEKKILEYLLENFKLKSKEQKTVKEYISIIDDPCFLYHVFQYVDKDPDDKGRVKFIKQHEELLCYFDRKDLRYKVLHSIKDIIDKHIESVELVLPEEKYIDKMEKTNAVEIRVKGKKL